MELKLLEFVIFLNNYAHKYLCHLFSNKYCKELKKERIHEETFLVDFSWRLFFYLR